MKKAFYTLFSVTLMISNFVFAGGDLINNGGGIAEKNIMFAYQKLDTYLKLCLSSDFCKIDSAQRVILQQITNGLIQEKLNPNQIQFASERNQKGFFILDGEVKVAKTGSQIGSPIYINTDLIYTKNEMGYYIPASIADATAILVHELGHHYGAYSHTDLDLLGVRVAMMIQHKTYNTPLLPWSQQISATIINPNVNDSFPAILLYIEDQVIDLSSQFEATVNCPKFIIPIPILPIPDIPVNVKKPLGTLVHNVHWEKIGGREDKKALLQISGDLSHKCKESDDVNVRNQDFRIRIEFAITQGDDGKWSLDADTLKLEQKRDAWWKIIKFSIR